MRILWYSNAPWNHSGYGGQTALFAPRIADLGHDIAVVANYGLQGGIVDWKGIPVYPRGGHVHGLDGMVSAAKHFNPDIIVTLYDLWAFEGHEFGTHWVPWIPVDTDPAGPATVRAVQSALAPLAMSCWGQSMLTAAGVRSTHIPLAVDTGVFRPGDHTRAREALTWPQDAFIVGMVAMNKSPRKHLAAQIEAFAEFSRTHPDAYLYLHTHDGTVGDGINLVELVRQLGIEHRVLFVDQWHYRIGYTPEEMALRYQAMDVLLSVSHSEGFGVPILEAQACNTPVIAGDWSAMPEHLFEGYLIDPADTERVWADQGGFRWAARIDAIVTELAAAYDEQGILPPSAPRAYQFDATVVTRNYWKPLLAELEQRIGGM